MLLIHSFVATHYLKIVLPTSLFRYILVTHEPHFLLCYTRGVSFSSAPLGFYTPSLNHANPVLSLQSTNSLIRTRSTNYGTERFRNWSHTISCSKVMSVKYAMSSCLMLMKIDIRHITWNLSISNCGWVETTITITLPEDLHAFLHARRA